MNIICYDARKLQLVSTDSAKKELSKSDGLGPRYKQSYGVGVHVDISTQRQEGVNSYEINKSINHTKPPLGWIILHDQPVSGGYCYTVLRN